MDLQSDHAERSVHNGEAIFDVALHIVGSAGASGRSLRTWMVYDSEDVGADDGINVGNIVGDTEG